MSVEQNADFLAFVAWAAREGYDTAHTYDTHRRIWIAFNPMTADLWRAWQAAHPDAQSRIAALEAELAGAYALLHRTEDEKVAATRERDEALARVASLQDVIEQLIACHDEPTCPALDVARAALSATPAESSTTKETP